ncbi:MAG TPA: Zn-ribbon domain-containing OB-fold protein [Anaerolineales bacterium]
MTTETAVRPFTAASFNRYLNEKKLMGSRCTRCGALYLPPRAICPSCHAAQMEWVELGGRGKLAAFTAISIGPTSMNDQGYGRDNPYVTGIVELDEGVRISARILGVDAKHPAGIRVGLPLRVEFIEQGEGKQAVLGFRAEE